MTWVHCLCGRGTACIREVCAKCEVVTVVTAWAILALSVILLAFFAGDLGDALGVTGLLFGEFVAVCLWNHYYGNSRLVSNIVCETQNRLEYLLTQGLGMSETEREKFLAVNEKAIVDLWMKNLKGKRWGCLSRVQMDELIFDMGVECGRTMADHLWEGAFIDVAAFMHEWASEVEELRRPIPPSASVLRNPIVLDIGDARVNIRVPDKIKRDLISGNDDDSQALLAVIVANEDEELRRLRATRKKDLHNRQFSAARIAQRKTAAEGMLHWPECVSHTSGVKNVRFKWDTSSLSIIDGRKVNNCTEDMILDSVMYTIVEVIKAGYVRLLPAGKTVITITFQYGNMVFEKDKWNPSRKVQRKPFRYITSATWMAGNIAFMVAQREVTGQAAHLNGSGILHGNLTVTIFGTVETEDTTWVERSSPPDGDGGETIWGNIGDLIESRTTHFLNKPMVLMIQLAWKFLGLLRCITMQCERSKMYPIRTCSLPESLRRRASSLTTAAQ